MSKKNKKNKVDYFNMSPEEQKANAEMFHDVETGELSFLDALKYKVPTAPIAQSDYTRQIEKACLGNIEEEDNNNYITAVDDAIMTKRTIDDEVCDIEDTKTSGYIPYSEVVVKDTIIHEETLTSYESSHSDDTHQSEIKENTGATIPRVKFKYEPIVGKLLIDDGLVVTPVSICHTSSIELNPDSIPMDNDRLGEVCSKLFFYIISCKHPAVIMSEDTFEIEFSLYSEINFNKFIFFKNNGFVYAYVLNENESENFYNIANIFNMTDDELLRYVVGTACAANNMHNIFMYNDEDEVESVMEARHDVKELLKLIDNDSATKYAGHNASGSVLHRMKVSDLQALISDIHDILDNLINEDDDVEDDDDDDDDDDVEDDDNTFDDSDDNDVDVYDFPSIDTHTDTDDIDSLIEETESTDVLLKSVTTNTTITRTSTISETVKPDDDDNNDESEDDMILPIIHRR